MQHKPDTLPGHMVTCELAGTFFFFQSDPIQ